MATASAGRQRGRGSRVSLMIELLRRALGDLASLQARYALVGGHAVSARTEPRFTRDLDLAVAVTNDREAEALVTALGSRGYRIVAIVEQEATGRLATVRLEHGSAPGVMVDLLFATAGIESEVVDAATTVSISPELAVPVASVGHLLALKVLSIDDRTRPQDRLDVAALLRTATTDDLRIAGQALNTIRERGCDRGRDLPSWLERLRQELAP